MSAARSAQHKAKIRHRDRPLGCGIAAGGSPRPACRAAGRRPGRPADGGL